MDTPEGEQHGPVIEPDRVLATYQHVRERWGLKNADTARMKAKRAGWAHQPKNSPSDVTRLIVPREQWDAVGDRSRRTASAAPEEHDRGNNRGISPLAAEALTRSTAPDLLKSLSDALATLQEQLERERQRADAAETRAAQAEADARNARQEASEARQEATKARQEATEAVGQAAGLEAEVEQTRTALAGLEDQLQGAEEDRTRLRAERDAAQTELASWMAGGPFARAVRAFLHRR